MIDNDDEATSPEKGPEELIILDRLTDEAGQVAADGLSDCVLTLP
jgi:hypothetical protein